MTKRKTVRSSVDTGTPPAGAIQAKKLKELIISGEELPEELVEAPTADEPDLAYERVRLEHALYSLDFKSLDVSISEHQVAIKIPNSAHFRFEPKVDSKFKIVYRKNSYDAVYLGGIFNFTSDNTWAITFILSKDAGSGPINEKLQE